MPFDYVIDKARRVVFTTGTGIVTISEIYAHYERLLADPDFDRQYNQLLDFTRAKELTASVEEIASCARRTIFSPDSRRAWVASSPAIYGIGRLAVSHHELSASPSQACAFNDLSSAMEWLGLGKGAAG
jgi:hypothetical protein